MKKKVLAAVIGVFGILHGIYGFIMMSESLLYGVLWLCIGFIELAGASFGLYLNKTRPKLSMLLLSLMTVCLALNVFFDGIILVGSVSLGTKNADKVIVLGYQLKKDTASETLVNRIETAYEYAKEYPQSKLIVTGGTTGSNTKSEAEVMKGALVSYGIDSIRIFEEKEAKNTIDNMRLSKEFISSKDKVVLITSNYHCLRAKVLAKKMGYSVKTIGASAPLKLLLNQLLLEKISLIQILIFGV